MPAIEISARLSRARPAPTIVKNLTDALDMFTQLLVFNVVIERQIYLPRQQQIIYLTLNLLKLEPFHTVSMDCQVDVRLVPPITLRARTIEHNAADFFMSGEDFTQSGNDLNTQTAAG